MTQTTPAKQRMGPDQRRAQILAVATKHFEQYSYNEVSTEAIARDAGVGRPLIHHYFGTKRELYLQVIRRLAVLPPLPGEVVQGIPESGLERRIVATIDAWLTMASRRRIAWTSTVITAEAPIRDADIAAILAHAESVAADRMLEALGLKKVPNYELLHTMMLSFGALAIRVCRQWLVEHTLTRDQVSALLNQTLLAITCDVAPQFET